MKNNNLITKIECLVLVLLILCISNLVAEPCGDVNSKDGINIVDALLIAQYYVGLDPVDFDEAAADVNADNKINIVDALLIAQLYVGLINELPGCSQTPIPTNPPQFIDCSEAPIWSADEIYDTAGKRVQYNGNLYENNWYSQNQNPEQNSGANKVWTLIGPCNSEITPVPATPTPTPVSTQTTVTTAPPGEKGYININDRVPGWASQGGGTTGGGTNIGNAVTVSSMSSLKSEASGSSGKIILVEPGNYSGTLSPGANKTIIGKAPGVTIRGNINISGSDKKNIIIRNLAVRGNTCGSYDDCKSGPDAVYMGNGARNIWLDHLDIADGQDGNCDITKEGDYITVSWTQFHYTYNKEHRFSNLIAGSDSETQSRGKLQITYMNCWWGDRVEQRQPRGRFGKVHMFNNFHSSKASGQYCAGPGVEISMIIENCFYEVSSGTQAIRAAYGTPTGWKATGNEGNAEGMNSQQGSVFNIPYSYTKIPASQVKAAITASNGGAGNTCQLQL